MDRDEVMKLARDAGYGESMVLLHAPALERFATLVAAAEREECAKVCYGYTGRDPLGVSLNCADAIRARSEK